MGKKIVILLIGVLILAPIAIVGVDIAMTISSISDPSTISVSTGTPTASLSVDNTTLSFSVDVTITTPSLGFIPKTVSIELQIYEGSTAVGDPIKSEITLGGTSTSTISGQITLTSQQTQTIAGGGSITFTVKGTATVKMLGIALPGAEFAIPEQTVSAP